MIKRANFTKDDRLVLEAAKVLGFAPASDNATVFVCTDEQIVEFSFAIQQAILARVLISCPPSGSA